VVVDGQERLQSGTPVEVHDASPSAPAGGSVGSGQAPGNNSNRPDTAKSKKQGKQS